MGSPPDKEFAQEKEIIQNTKNFRKNCFPIFLTEDIFFRFSLNILSEAVFLSSFIFFSMLSRALYAVNENRYDPGNKNLISALKI